MADSVPVGRRVPIPRGIEGRIEVFRNGVPVQEGVDFHVEDGDLVFRVPLACGRPTGLLGKIQMSLLGIGLYETIDKIDIHATGPDGAVRIASELTGVPGSE
jgi:hypothetical protein